MYNLSHFGGRGVDLDGALEMRHRVGDGGG